MHEWTPWFLIFLCFVVRFVHGSFLPTSNGLISPDMPAFNRRPGLNSSGGTLLAEVMYPQPLSFIVPPPRQQYAPTFYPPAKRLYCANCGEASHTRAECMEPSDSTENMSRWQRRQHFPIHLSQHVHRLVACSRILLIMICTILSRYDDRSLNSSFPLVRQQNDKFGNNLLMCNEVK